MTRVLRQSGVIDSCLLDKLALARGQVPLYIYDEAWRGVPGLQLVFALGGWLVCLQNLFHAPTSHFVTVVFKDLFIEYFIATLEIEVQVLLRVGN